MSNKFEELVVGSEELTVADGVKNTRAKSKKDVKVEPKKINYSCFLIGERIITVDAVSEDEARALAVDRCINCFPVFKYLRVIFPDFEEKLSAVIVVLDNDVKLSADISLAKELRDDIIRVGDKSITRACYDEFVDRFNKLPSLSGCTNERYRFIYTTIDSLLKGIFKWQLCRK